MDGLAHIPRVGSDEEVCAQRATNLIPSTPWHLPISKVPYAHAYLEHVKCMARYAGRDMF